MEYSAYAIRIDSDIALDLPAADSGVDTGSSGFPPRRIAIVRAEVREEFATSGSCDFFRFGKSDTCILVEVFTIGRFRITGACLVEAEPFPGVNTRSLAYAIETVSPL